MSERFSEGNERIHMDIYALLKKVVFIIDLYVC